MPHIREEVVIPYSFLTTYKGPLEDMATEIIAEIERQGVLLGVNEKRRLFGMFRYQEPPPPGWTWYIPPVTQDLHFVRTTKVKINCFPSI